MREMAAERHKDNPGLAAYWSRKADEVDAVADYTAEKLAQIEGTKS